MSAAGGWRIEDDNGDGPCWVVRPGATAGWILRGVVCVCVCACILLPF